MTSFTFTHRTVNFIDDTKEIFYNSHAFKRSIIYILRAREVENCSTSLSLSSSGEELLFTHRFAGYEQQTTVINNLVLFNMLKVHRQLHHKSFQKTEVKFKFSILNRKSFHNLLHAFHKLINFHTVSITSKLFITQQFSHKSFSRRRWRAKGSEKRPILLGNLLLSPFNLLSSHLERT